MLMNIGQIRNDTLGCHSFIHLNNAGAALMPKPVANAVRDYITEEERGGGYEVANKKAEELSLFYEYAGRFLNCPGSSIAFTTNATDSYNTALSSIPFKEGDVVLLSGNDYPSNFIAFLSLQKRFGIKPVLVNNTDSGEIDLDDLHKKLRQYSPRLVSVTHVPTSSGLVQPAMEIGKIVKQYDTLYLLDACQSVGQMSVDATALGADFISGTFRKFLRGPRGAGFLYVSPKALQTGLEPLFPDLRGAEWIAEDAYMPRQDAKRFEIWETAFALQMGSKEALLYTLQLGIENIEERNKLLASQLREGLSGIRHIRLLDRGRQLCNIITFSVPGKGEEETKQYFQNKGIHIYTTLKSSALLDFEEKGVEWVVRASPHYYNTEEEIAAFIEAVKNL